MEADFLLIEFFGNTIKDYLWFLGAVILGLLFKQLISKYLSHLLFRLVGKRNNTIGIEKFDELLTRPIGFCLMLTIIFIGSSHIEYPIEWNLSYC